MGLRIDGTVSFDSVGLLSLGADLGDCILRGILKLLNELVHDIYEYNLRMALSNIFLKIGWQMTYFKARFEKLLTNEATADVATTKMDSFETHSCGFEA